MITSNIVLSSRAGGLPSVTAAAPTIVEDAQSGAPVQPNRAAGVAPAPNGAAPDPVVASALAKIAEIISAQNGEQSRSVSLAALEEYARNGGDSGARLIAENVRAASMTKKSLVEEIRSGEWLKHGDRAERTANVEMTLALRNGTASVLDLEEIGLRSRGIYTTHFTPDGEFAGVSAEIEADFDAIARFQDKSFIRHDDGTLTDRATGRNANFIQDGHKFLYVVWP